MLTNAQRAAWERDGFFIAAGFAADEIAALERDAVVGREPLP